MTPSASARSRAAASLLDLRVLGEAVAVIVLTWFALGWTPAATITQYDGSTLVAPYLQSALAGGVDWTHDLYRFGVVGGSVMHDFAGTMPIVQGCSLLGLSTTATVNVIVIFVQACIAFFGWKLITGWMTQWAGAGADGAVGRAAVAALRAPQRIAAIWICAFTPALGWRLAIGHDNLLIGLLPFLATLALFVAARAGTLSVTAIVVGMAATINGVTGLGAQTVMYGALFGAPIVLVSVLGAPRGRRWGRAQWAVTAALAAGVLIALPRLIGMIHHATGEDASRGLGESVTYSLGAGSWIDWLTSIPWTKALGVAAVGDDYVREHNYPLGPLLLFVIAMWPRGVGRGIVWALIASAAVAILFADDVAPVSSALLAIVKPLAAFRVPARAAFPIVVVVPPLALAAWRTPRATVASPTSPTSPAGPRWLEWAAVALGAAVIVVAHHRFAIAGELAAWLACGALVASVRWPVLAAHARRLAPLIVIVGALGVAAFGERLWASFVTDTVDVGPRALHDATLAQAPELRTAFDRVEIDGAPGAYGPSEAFAAQLPSLDGVWYPPSRFLALLSALLQKPVPSTTCVFQLLHGRIFPVLQQLYDVRYVIEMTAAGGSLVAQPDTLGAAWFPTTIVTLDDPARFARALSGASLHDVLRTTGWLLRSDAAHVPADAAKPPAACATASVRSVATDELGQTATIAVDAPAACPMIVATNYVTKLHAMVGDRELPVFPIDIALTAIEVPAGASMIALAPRADLPSWTDGAAAVGWALLAFAVIAIAREREVGA